MAIISKTKDGNTVIAGGHVRYAGENGHDWHVVPTCQKRNKEVAKGNKTITASKRVQ